MTDAFRLLVADLPGAVEPDGRLHWSTLTDPDWEARLSDGERARLWWAWTLRNGGAGDGCSGLVHRHLVHLDLSGRVQLVTALARTLGVPVTVHASAVECRHGTPATTRCPFCVETEMVTVLHDALRTVGFGPGRIDLDHAADGTVEKDIDHD